ncbi:hypothetical protein [Erwinia sorbitola]|uniref:Uncharacterized protein n=1 Tax=Erwinia sorbitola TaxID=2681984 RepID=A0A6I6ER99_9GAMM|nr:hypothetical protein [Erwinia sorbitola]MTD28616.1 hypothetical protein [Erwinia sorbitola]QGU86723.1 hypothetical protein GN242_05605 [Erwinia sorbitola]
MTDCLTDYFRDILHHLNFICRISPHILWIATLMLVFMLTVWVIKKKNRRFMHA